MMASIAKKEIEKINSYEKSWKIRTNPQKFVTVPIRIHKKEDIVISNEPTEYSSTDNILGLKISRTGYKQHVTFLTRKGNEAITILRRFWKLPTNLKVHLCKAYIFPIIEYPPIPLTTLSKSTLLKLQKVQNKALRFAYNERYPYTKTSEDLHKLSNIEALNTRLFDRAKAVTTKPEAADNQTLKELKEQSNNIEHQWFRKALNRMNNRPEAFYTK